LLLLSTFTLLYNQHVYLDVDMCNIRSCWSHIYYC